MAPWTEAHLDPLSTGFPRQQYLSGLPLPSLGYLPNPVIEPTSLHCRRILSKGPLQESKEEPSSISQRQYPEGNFCLVLLSLPCGTPVLSFSSVSSCFTSVITVNFLVGSEPRSHPSLSEVFRPLDAGQFYSHWLLFLFKTNPRGRLRLTNQVDFRCSQGIHC